MSYKLVKSDSKFNIFETESENTIELHLTEKDAKVLCRRLNLGIVGFNGWTPQFLAKKLIKSS